MKLFTAMVAVALIAGVTIFYACEKEDVSNQTTNSADITESVEKDYESYIEKLIASTGIDIHKLSKSDGIEEIAETNLTLMEMADGLLDEKGGLTEEKLSQLQDLGEAINAASAAGDDDEVLRLYASFCAVCMTIDGFIFNMNEYGLQTFSYDPDKESLQLPIAYMEAEMVKAEALMKEMETNNPTFPTLSPSVQTEVMAAAISVSILRRMETKAQSVADCKKAALADYGIAMAGCMAGLEIALHACAFSAAAVGPCVAVAFAGYGVAVGFATWGYKRALNRCG
ncbi:MAG: hypothetical protein LBV02_03015 [Bacteroidales bacterium]|jgi:hypothetical protein|nr:hypothetical protein [Bacteroidales bacterium]